MAKKEPKYKVEQMHSDALGPYWVIWMGDYDVHFQTEDVANLTCSALNAYDGIRKLKRKAQDLEMQLRTFNEED